MSLPTIIVTETKLNRQDEIRFSGFLKFQDGSETAVLTSAELADDGYTVYRSPAGRLVGRYYGGRNVVVVDQS